MAASTIIGSMTVNVNANTKNFAKGMAKTRKGLSFATVGAKAFSVAIASIGAYASIQGIRRLAGVIGETAGQLDKLAKTSDKLGIASEKLAGLQHAGEITGVSMETMNMALQRMTRRVAEAAKGTGEAKGALKELGINAEELMKLSLDEQFSTIAEKMSGVEKQADKVRLAMKLFDSEGVALVNTLKLGSGGLEAMQREAEALGIAIDRKALAKVEAMNDAVTRLKATWGGAKNQLTINIAPAAAKMLEDFLMMYKEWKLGRGAKSFDVGISGEGGSRFIRGGIDVRNPFNPSDGMKINNATASAATKKNNKDFIVAMSQQIGKGLVTGSGVVAGARTNAAGMIGAFGTAAARIAGKTLQNYGDVPNMQSVNRSPNDILTRGTSEAFTALRANLNKTDDKQLKLAEKAQEHRVELIEAVKQIFVPSVASI